MDSTDRCNTSFSPGTPKAILIFTGFLPRFQEWIAIAAYAYMGLHMRRWFARPQGKEMFNRCCAGLLSAATVLLMARRA